MATVDADQLAVRPLGVFAPQRSLLTPLTRSALLELVGTVPEQLRRPVAEHLRGAKMVVALMGYTRDVIDGRFGVTGGSSLMSDGTYYWPLETADYVEEYGVALPEEAIEHMRAHRWVPPDLDEATDLRVYRYLRSELARPVLP